ncbi:sensor histidine kinase [Clostridium sp. YIM B02515]|uniref:histidine kinase n=1 Tax=Clostridium rhizosphaerae TaxID=2803861 RepID=A0ABS1TAZ9_9CLOT|nr:HAMP domain-containing sensor histidine kinase [Clostridium rhizosphaerae]MBL4936510.1 sensor histidine kinase [Clostridium rhizosphaerae]
MDIKLKNKNLKLIIFVLSLISITLALCSMFNFKVNKEYLNFKSYFESRQFESRLNEFYSDFKNYNVDYKDYGKKSIDDKINTDNFNNLKNQYDNQLENKLQDTENQYDSQIENAESNGNKDKVTRLTEEKNKKLEEIKKQNTKSADDIKKELAKRSDDNYNSVKKQYESITDIKYYLKDSKSGDIYSNLNNVDDIQNYIKSSSAYSFSLPNNSPTTSTRYVSNQLSGLGLEGYVIVPKTSPLVSNSKEFNTNKILAIIQLIVFPVFLAAGVLMLRYSRKAEIDNHSLIIASKKLYNKVPFDLKLLILFFALIISPNIYRDLYYQGMNVITSDFFINLILTTLLTYFLYISIPDIINCLKNRENLLAEIKSGLLYKFKDIILGCLKDKNLMFITIIFIIGTVIFGVIAAAISLSAHAAPELFILATILYVFFVIILLLKNIVKLDKIIKGTDEIVKGNLSYVIKEKGKGNLSRLAHNINNMKTGISKAVESQMKSDRLKSELITNVSHDLKTPLTSIINYVDLLKKEDLSKEEVEGYIKVLERKTERLKVLIEDLFEASKMASGAVELNIEKVDVAQLLSQSLAELDEKIKASGLIFKVNIPHHKVYSNLDGKKTWRVFENLIGNILKYSQIGTRVYIDLTENDDKNIITMKNISAYEMEFVVDEIFERFKRGDTSRATEGSGLGLAIAKSIVDLQGGRLDIDIDGDLFKVRVEFNK